jgi:hypothetical protein
MRLSELQEAFRDHLLGRDASPALTAQVREDGIPVARRLAVYRNNVGHALMEALGAAYPVVRRLVGEDFFVAVARNYTRAHPPTRGTLIGYGEGFPDYLEKLPAAARLPYLADVARLERAWLAAYHASDATPLQAGDLTHLPPESLPALRLRLHPSARLLATRHPVREIWALNRQPGPVPAMRLGGGPEYSLIIRPRLTVGIRPLSAGEYTFLRALMDDATLTGAFEAALAVAPNLDLQTHLHQHLTGDSFAGWQAPPRQGDHRP